MGKEVSPRAFTGTGTRISCPRGDGDGELNPDGDFGSSPQRGGGCSNKHVRFSFTRSTACNICSSIAYLHLGAQVQRLHGDDIERTYLYTILKLLEIIYIVSII
jgi:hypothetical protein